MGFYVNVKAKKGCLGQMNKLWKRQFGGFLIYTPSRIKKEIEFLQNDEKSKHLRYIKTISDWDKTFSILANGSGQIFIRPYGYSEERSVEFEKENQEIKSQIKFVLDHRMLL